MNTIIVIGCTKTKSETPSPAREVYSASKLFYKEVAYVEKNYAYPWVILSGKLGIVAPDEVISPYRFDPRTLNKTSSEHLLLISNIKKHLHNYDQIIAFCGKTYVELLQEACTTSKIIEPLKGMGIGQRLRFLSKDVIA